MDQSGFNVTSPTVLAANLGNNKFIIQVCPSSVRLLDAAAIIVYELEMDSGFQIASASASDPFVSLISSDGRIGLLKFIEGSQLELAFPIPNKVKVLLLISNFNS